MRVESIAIDRSPGEVFAFFDDRANDGRWMASVVESEWLDQAARTGVGRRGRMVMKLLGRREFLDEVVEYEPGTRVASCRARWGLAPRASPSPRATDAAPPSC